MPTPVMKSFAKKSNKKVKTVEKLWKKAEKLVKKKYEIEKDSPRYWPLVVGITKNLLGINEPEENEEVDGVEEDVMTTANIGDATFANKIGAPATRIDGSILQVASEIKPKKKYKKKIEETIKILEEKGLDFSDIMDETLEYYSNKNNEWYSVKNAYDYFKNYIIKGKSLHNFGVKMWIFDNAKNIAERIENSCDFDIASDVF
jgi:hypothetical protein